MTSIVSPPRLTGNPAQDVRELQDYCQQLYKALFIEAEVTDRLDRIADLPPLALTVSNPPTQDEMQKIANRLDEIVNVAAIGAANGSE